MKQHYDVVVIGSGPGGEGAAMTLVKGGKKVALVEKYEEVGGNCTHRGTIPSKSLRHEAQLLASLRQHPAYTRLVRSQRYKYSHLLKAATRVMQQQSRLRESFYFRNRVDIITGRARFSGSHQIEVENRSGQTRTLVADQFVIATGSGPYRPANVPFDHPRIDDSDSILKQKLDFRSITIYGAGVIGCEYASIFANLGIKVNLVNTRDQLLSFLDSEISDALGYHLRDQAVAIRHNEVYDRIEPTDKGVIMHTRSGKRIHDEIFLWANGRTGDTGRLCLDQVGLEADHRGQLQVNEHYQTAVQHIYAVGDVIGFPSLASASYDQGRFAAAHILDGKSDLHVVRDIPNGIYTDPEISAVGKTERELTEAGIPYEVGRALFKNIARAQITGQTTGMLKILFHIDTLEILGIHCFGYQASEILHIGQAIMSQAGEANSISYFVNTNFNYPTMAEAYRVAALNGLNRLC
jgi:NAD(P) transhydrogenase